eukprot:510808-Pyramimonas_sp.AAC.1
MGDADTKENKRGGEESPPISSCRPLSSTRSLAVAIRIPRGPSRTRARRYSGERRPGPPATARDSSRRRYDERSGEGARIGGGEGRTKRRKEGERGGEGGAAATAAGVVRGKIGGAR